MDLRRTGFAAVGTAAFVALALRYRIDVRDAGALWPAATSYFAYFTIWANVLAAHVAFAEARSPVSRPEAATGATMIVVFVGVVYEALLAADHDPEGLAAAVNVMLHYVVPGGMLALWALVPKGTLGWGAAVRWLALPLAYLAVALARGLVDGYWPYFFLNVDREGPVAVLLWCVGLTLLFLALGAGFVALDRLLGRGRAVLDEGVDG